MVSRASVFAWNNNKFWARWPRIVIVKISTGSQMPMYCDPDMHAQWYGRRAISHFFNAGPANTTDSLSNWSSCCLLRFCMYHFINSYTRHSIEYGLQNDNFVLRRRVFKKNQTEQKESNQKNSSELRSCALSNRACMYFIRIWFKIHN